KFVCCLFLLLFFFCFFFFSSRRRHTRSLRDWSSDVCSSDLDVLDLVPSGFLSSNEIAAAELVHWDYFNTQDQPHIVWPASFVVRSEERRVGKECRTRWSAEQEKKREKEGVVRTRGRSQTVTE